MEIDDRRDSYTSTLTVPCTIWRDGRDAYGAHTGDKNQKVSDTYCGVSSGGGAGMNSLVNTIVHLVSVRTPGARTLSFAWNEDVETADEVRIGSDDFRQGVYYKPNPTVGDAKYVLGQVNNDDPVRVGVQVDAEVVRTK